MSTAIDRDTTVLHREPSYNEKREDSLEEAPLEEKEDRYEDHDVAVFVGCVLGSIVGASNIYLGLKTGFTFGAQLFGAIFGFAILKALSKALPDSGLLGFLGGPFGPKENCTVQSAATAAGGLGILMVSAVPAMYQLNLLSDDPSKDIGKLIALVSCTAFFGVFFVIPLRKYFIVHQKLTFPTPAATAYTIRSLHRGKSGAAAARKKSLALLYSFCAVFVFKVVSGYAPGILYDWHIGWTLYRLGFTSMINLENYGWWIQFTPAFFGAGMLSGLNASWSFFGGTVLAWGIISPSLIKNGLAFGKPISEEYPLVTYMSMSLSDPNSYAETPSPRYWLLWPGVLIMLMYSFADVIITCIPIVRSSFWSILNEKIPYSYRLRHGNEDKTPMADRIPTSWWTIGLLLSTVMSCAILATQFHMNVGEAILALLLGFLFSFIGIQSSGYTDVNPVSTVAKASQLIFGGISKGTGLAIHPAQTLNMTAGVIAAGSAAQATDMTGDLKTGYLLRAKPKNQFIAQLCGSVVSIFLTCGLFILFTKASPCIIHPDEDGPPCTYGAPSVAAWAAVAIAVTAPKLPIPASSGYTAIGLAIFSVVCLVVKTYWVPKKYWGYFPNWNAVGLAFVVPNLYYSIAMAVGSTFNHFWLLRNPAGYDMYMFAVSAGMLAGEGLGGVLQALLAIAGVDGQAYGTAIGCPGMEFCG
ncbi:hypothetical protein CVT25_003339 [Psilocybe cyanescens]|uniref:Oligopeptide transporter n=1 Tax=Psilocybe cyanescens TaxID=93625 RepID=A0A409X066_PSICY|nr:hypothetical protein CVT25_003339 [Psilocybe cyanescens]